jgi:hypothetical protein
MSIRLIAKDLYRLEKDVEQLEAALAQSPADKRPELEDKLRKARAERDRMRAMLEGSKEDLPYRRPL